MIIVKVIRNSKDALLAVCTFALGYILISALVIFNVEADSFETFFDAIYWATVSLTTVGYGDIYPITTTGRIITMISSFFGIAVVALPAGIITAGYMEALGGDREEKDCDITTSYYNVNAQDFFDGTVNVDTESLRERFLSYVPDGGSILDLGCGSGRDSKCFIDAGYRVTAIDASKELCTIASEYAGIDVRCMRFEELEDVDTFDGVFACASLLHVPATDLPDILAKIRVALKPQGVLYASFKYGDFAGIRDGRFFRDMNEESVEELFASVPGFKIEETWQSHDVRRGKDAYWINVIARKN
jgi:SAM-dependent methyltransferase